MAADQCNGLLGTPFADLDVRQYEQFGDNNCSHHMPGNITVDV